MSQVESSCLKGKVIMKMCCLLRPPYPLRVVVANDDVPQLLSRCRNSGGGEESVSSFKSYNVKNFFRSRRKRKCRSNRNSRVVTQSISSGEVLKFLRVARVSQPLLLAPTTMMNRTKGRKVATISKAARDRDIQGMNCAKGETEIRGLQRFQVGGANFSSRTTTLLFIV